MATVKFEEKSPYQQAKRTEDHTDFKYKNYLEHSGLSQSFEKASITTKTSDFKPKTIALYTQIKADENADADANTNANANANADVNANANENEKERELLGITYIKAIFLLEKQFEFDDQSNTCHQHTIVPQIPAGVHCGRGS
ncbi:hypothetical protein Avbf_03550 [Armadillidium vulgare]|nr:hypothetical protein Avbf_03550 [Armadillidium vulgare]